jgi:hypothetical protein
LCSLLLPGMLWAKAKSGQSSMTRAETVSRAPGAHQLPPEMQQRFNALHLSLQPAARTWVERQASIEARRPAPDLAAVRAQIRTRFAASLSTAKAGSAPRAGQLSLKDVNIDTMAFIVLMEATNEMDHDLRQLTAKVEAATAAKEQLRDLQTKLSPDLASAQGAGAHRPCHSVACQSLVERLGQIGEVAGQSGHPFRVAMRGIPTYAQLPQIMARLKGVQDKMNGFWQQEQTQWQTLAAKRAQFAAALASLCKSQQLASAGIVGNMK